MTSRPTRSLGILVALTALVAGVLATSPAQAATSALRISDTAAVYRDGDGPYKVRVPVTCTTSKACSGYIRFEGLSDYWRSFYSMSGKKSEYVEIRMPAEYAKNPFNAENTGSAARYTVQESNPSKRTTTHAVTTEKRVRTGTITGSFGGVGTPPSNAKVRLQVATSKGTSSSRVEVPTGGSFAFDNIPLGINNAPSAYYVMSVEGDVAGQHRSWYWRGSFDDSLGGTKEVRDASKIRVTATTPDYRANVRYGEITGTMREGLAGKEGEVTIATAPYDAVAPGSRIAHGLDIDSCANVQAFVRTNASGFYKASFLPTSQDGGDKRYLVSGDDNDSSTVDRWYGQTESFGSCLHARGYSTAASASQNLLALDGSATKDLPMSEATGSVEVTPRWSATAYQSDKIITLREKVPGEPVLESPIVKRRIGSSGKNTLANVAPGQYWLEVGRETSCGGWVASRYPDNNLYLKGEDRGSERWKTVSGRTEEYQKSRDMGYVRTNPPRGYKGWMYRQVCKSTAPTKSQGGAIGAGKYETVVVGTGVVEADPVVPKGAYVTGRVTRVGGKSNKELMVTLYSTSGTLVKRQALTDGSGRFKITGLATGNYRVSVNTDSWRGIGRGFYGAKTKRVTAGRGYSIGTLKFTS